MEEYINLKILGRNDRDEITKKVRSTQDQQLYVIKTISQGLSQEQKNILNILLKNECPYIVNHYYNEERKNEIITDYINNGDLLEYMNTFMDLEKNIDEKILLKIFLQCVESVKYIHSKNIIHRNIRLENFYMSNDMEIKLGNFKYAVIKGDNDEYSGEYNNPEGTLYKSEESLNNSIYNEKTDIYSLGVVFHKLCFFQFPYEPTFEVDSDDEDDEGEMRLIPFPEDTKKNLDKYSDDIKNLINSMLSKEDKRPNIYTIYNKIKNKYDELCSFNNTCIENVLRCFSTFGAVKLMINSIQFLNENKTPIIFYYLHCINEFIKQKETKNMNEYIKYINLFRHNLEKVITIKKDEEPRPFEVANFFIEKYLEEIIGELRSYGDNAENNKKIKDVGMYFTGEFRLPSEYQNNNNDIKSLYNSFRVDLDKCSKDLITNKVNISLLFENLLLKGDNLYYKENLTFPGYLVISINRGKNYLNTSDVSFPKEFTIVPYIFILTGFVKRKIKNCKEYFISVYNSENDIWMLSEENELKKINLDDEINNSDGLIEIIFYKKKSGTAKKSQPSQIYNYY